MMGISAHQAARFFSPDAPVTRHGSDIVYQRLYDRPTTDGLLEQVKRLSGDGSVTPSAIVILAGAALEHNLRERCLALSLIDGEDASTLEKLKGLLVKEGHLVGARAEQRIGYWRDLRNDVMHGRHEASRDEAAEMLNGIVRYVESGEL